MKRKAIAVIQRISRHESGILTNVHEKIRLRLEDTDLYVAASALSLLYELSRVRINISGVCVTDVYILHQARILKPREGVDLIFSDFLSLQTRRARGIRRPQFQLVKVIGRLICESLEKEYVSP